MLRELLVKIDRNTASKSKSSVSNLTLNKMLADETAGYQEASA